MKKLPVYCLVLLSFCIILGSCSNPAGGSGSSGESVITPAVPLNYALYVAPAAAGAGDGSSWGNAMNDVQAAIEAAADEGSGKTHVLIKAGTYEPKGYPNLSGVQTDERLKHFSLRNGVTVIGGFRGDEGDTNPLGGTTVLSGGPVTSGVPGAGNVYHVFYHPNGTGLGSTAALKNVTVTGGNANENGNILTSNGGGMYNYGNSPTIINCTFSENRAAKGGGGMYNVTSSPVLTDCNFSLNSVDGTESSNGGGGMYNAISSPVLKNCIFLDNSASKGGGGVYNSGKSNPTFTDCIFSGNITSENNGNYNEGGGGIYISVNENSTSTLTNCTFSGNSGGGICNWSDGLVLINCTFSENSARRGGGIYNGGRLYLTNCTFSGNSADEGGGMYNFTYAIITNCTFSGNSVDSKGGGMYNWTGSIRKVFGSIFAGNYKSDGSAVNEIEWDIDPESKDNLILGINYNGTLEALFAVTEGSGNKAYGILGDNGGPTKTIKINAIPKAQISLPESWSYLENSGTINVPMPGKDQRGYTRSTEGGIGYKGAVDPRVP